MNKSKNRHKATLYYMGILCLFIWIVDFFNIVFLIHKPQFLLWYSNFGLLAVALALLRKNSRLIFTLFCALFVFEMIWTIGFFSIVLFHKHIPGVVDYAFNPKYLVKDFVLTLYHLLIPPALLIGFMNSKKVYRDGWIGALAYTLVLTFLTYFLVDKRENINCVHTITHCRSFVPFLYKLHNPLRIFIGLAMVTILVFIPTNYILYKIGKYLKWK